jgi:molybdopterin-biosynthesis enzyme MoeA-like protein
VCSSIFAKAFDVKHSLSQEAKEMIEKHLVKACKEIREDHIRMAYIPESAILLLNDETGAPGFKIENVFVMAGVPYIMQSIFVEAKKFLKKNNPIISKEIEIDISEGVIAKQFSDLQNIYPNIEMGSYPFKKNDKWGTSLVLRGDDIELLDKAMEELLKIIAAFKVNNV